MKVEPLTKPNPTNRDIAEQVNMVHSCLEEHRGEMTSALRAMNSKHDKLNSRVEHLARDVNSIADALGTKPERAKSTLATMTPHRAVLGIAATTGSTLAGLFVVWKLVIVVGPVIGAGLWAVVVSVNHLVVG